MPPKCPLKCPLVPLNERTARGLPRRHKGRRAPTPVSSIRCGGQVSRVPKPPRCSSTAAAGTAAGVALEAGAVANQGEVAPFAATLTLVAFDPRFARPFHPTIPFPPPPHPP